MSILKKLPVLKRIDELVITSFIPPFIVAFSVSLFVLLMQMLWIYIDDLAGKGLGFFTVIELLSYRAVSFVPMALPLGILLSSVMLMGNFAEHYELSSMKSAGLSLVRIMRPMLIFSIFTVAFSWYCSDYLIPAANLKFGSRMWDIQQTKPALRLDVGVFNDDFQGFTIHIGKKMSDGRTIKDVIIYDHSEANSGKYTVITAKDGEMFTSEDGNIFVMRLRNGYQCIESRGYQSSSQSKYPFIRTGFKQFTKVFDLTEFSLSRTNEELFKQSRQTMDSRALKAAADSMALDIHKRTVIAGNYVANYVSIFKVDSTYLKKEVKGESTEQNRGSGPTPISVSAPAESTFDSAHSVTLGFNVLRSTIIKRAKPISVVSHFADTFSDADKSTLRGRAESAARGVQNQTVSTTTSLSTTMENRVKFIYDWQMKYSIAVVCFIFMFIGAPMGAIVRKGGFGYPLLVAIVFFMLFVILTIFCRKIAETFVVSAYLAAWLPCLILMPLGIWLTYKAMNDQPLNLFEGVRYFFQSLVKRLRNAKTVQG
ncbi:LptF/LptG family permease [Haliscomenobacter hydrossis]|uniref:Permease YjgP/YjgQ family protein n=1 Tax=Haliscomenobacter hydrossis (strain ATCC 27775 / DSM 1100 / LMG 10767 / O) TaxID=760192 RepID=F4KP57_HALH1|nr:LptF/LptG family permease [Haliscomenobacter hydrossis]AEE48851.1 permease YjgP/YjgQ family protein [Haliscomenobacter hydrossis DSM 1100]